MKKNFYFGLMFIFALMIITGCNGSDGLDDSGGGSALERELRIVTPRGPGALGMLDLMERNQTGDTDVSYVFTLVGSPDEMPPLLIRGDVDIAAVPPNLASILHNNPNIDIQALAVVTMGVLHIVDSSGEIGSVEDLRGRTIHASGGGGTPEFILNHVLNGNGLTPGVDVYLDFRPEFAEIAALLEGGIAEIAMLPEPFATTVLTRVEGVTHALDLSHEWNRLHPDAGLVMTVVIARTEVVENYPELINVFMSEYEESISFVQQNVNEAAELAVSHDIIPAAHIAREAIPRSNIVFVTGERMQRYVDGVLRVFYEQLPQSVGGQLPDASFYFAH